MGNANGVRDVPPTGVGWAEATESAGAAEHVAKPQGNSHGGDSVPPTGDGIQSASLELSIPVLPPPINKGLALEVLFQALGMKERQVDAQSGMQSLKVKADERQAINDKKLEDIQKQLEDMKSKGVLDGFLKAFKIIGIILGAIAAIAVTALGAVTGNPVLIAAGVLLCAMAVNSVLSAASEGKYSIATGIGELAKKCGASDEAAQWIGFGFEMGITVVGCALSLGGGAAAAGAEAAQSAGKATEIAGQVTKVVDVTNKVTNIAGGINAVGQGVTQGVSAGYEYKASMSQATQKELAAVLERLNQSMDMEMDFIKSVMTRSQDLMDAVKDIVQGNIATQTAVLKGAAPAMA